jgi:phage shock protein C
MYTTTQRLMRSRSEKIIAGVAGGIAQYLGIESVIVRLAFVALCFTGVGILLYPVLWLIMPLEGEYSSGNQYARPVSMNGEAEDGEIPIQNIGAPPRTADEIAQRNRRLGQILIAVGAVILLNILLGPMMGRLFFPLLLIGVGLWILRRR